MCIVLVAWRSHPDFPLVVAANRDEFFARRTASADFWPDHPQVLAGRDLAAGGGGTWIGISRDGANLRFAALTNYRDASTPRRDAPSRGLLVSDFLAGTEGIDAFLDGIAPRAAGYNGFNLLLGDLGEAQPQLAWYSNVGGERRELGPGIYGVSNHLLDSAWPKVAAGKAALAAALEALPDDAALFELLRDDGVHPDEALPRTGVSLEWERLLSSAFVRAPGYGTRSSTVVVADRAGRVTFDEQTWREDGSAGERKAFRLRHAC
jgi:uncharacterized protein with NRDE domain